MEEQKVKLDVRIAGSRLPLRVSPDEVDQMKEIVSSVNRKIQEYQHTYQSLDQNDCAAMVLLTYAVDLNKYQHRHASDSDTVESPALSRIDELLDQYLLAT